MSPQAQQGPDRTLRDILNMLWRRKSVIFGTVLILTALAALVVSQLTPLYVAESQVVIEPPQMQVLDVRASLPGMDYDLTTNQTQAAVIESGILSEKLVERLDLTRNPLFNASLRPESKSAGMGAAAREWTIVQLERFIPAHWLAVFAGGDAETTPAIPTRTAGIDPARLEREAVIDAYRSRLTVIPSEISRVVRITYRLEDPVMAASIANALADLYIDDQKREKNKMNRRATTLLEERVSQQQRKVEATQKAVDEYRRSAKLIEVGGSRPLSQQLVRLNEELVKARGSRAEAQARSQQVVRLLGNRGDIETAAAVLDSPLIQRLREQEAEILRKIAELDTQVREGHPKMILARNELKDLQSKIEAEVNKIAQNLRNEVEIATVRERNLASEAASIEKQIEGQAQAEVTLFELERQAKAETDLYDTLLARLKETGIQDEAGVEANARVISYAAIPESAAFPRKRLILVVVFAASAMLGILLVFALEHLDNGFRSLEQIEGMTGLAGIAVLPGLRGVDGTPAGPADVVLDKPHSAFGEAIRALRTGLLLSNVDNPPRRVLVTSSIPSEGKSVTALSLARAAAKSGQRAIILDCDIRHPTLHTLFAVENDRGIVDYLSHEVRLEDIVRIDFRSGAHYILAGRALPNASDMLGSRQMRDLIRALGETYDLVVLDCPPVLAVSDTLVLLHAVDKVVFLVRWEKTPRDTAMAGVKQVIEAGGDFAGIVLTQADTKKLAKYSGYQGGYYVGYSGGRSYYTE